MLRHAAILKRLRSSKACLPCHIRHNTSATQQKPHHDSPELAKQDEHLTNPPQNNPIVEALNFPDPSTSKHHDLSSFETYASREGLDPSTTVYRGTHYEYIVQKALSRLGIATQRTGGANDLGIDLLGTWLLPTSPVPRKVFIQCKRTAISRALQIRELQGSFAGAPGVWRDEGTIGMLVTVKGATKGLRMALARSDLPMVHVVCTVDGRLVQMAWNRRAEDEGLDGVEVGMTYTSTGTKEVRLLWRGGSFGSLTM